MGSKLDSLWAICYKVFYPGAGVSGEAEVRELADQYIRDDCVECRAIIDE